MRFFFFFFFFFFVFVSDDFVKYCDDLENTPAWGGQLEVSHVLVCMDTLSEEGTQAFSLGFFSLYSEANFFQEYTLLGKFFVTGGSS